MTVAPVATIAAFNEWAKARDWPAVCDGDLAFASPALTDLLTIWREHAGREAMPQRGQLSARVLKAHLTQIAIFERTSVDPPRYRARLMGTKLTQILGDMQGKFLEDTAAPETVARWHAVLDLVLSVKRPLRFFNPIAYIGREHLQAESFGAPLAESGGAPTMVLVGIVFKTNFAAGAEVA
ncbi:MAG: PAS domain-containing protein [Alphaproteobacteria bacterium]|nr:PAS domain-containing protein [Alphaproteobacteria bacterium]MDE1987705.1 PAS domain-containing protein [Alphaproteobacteria bacterium]MDE2264829.1 PAS domain-containing protein [Alphaproteobacteria bacterium]MDE2499757.1 PAS domain-containing protein [Alphaproteobacteria bacterium]